MFKLRYAVMILGMSMVPAISMAGTAEDAQQIKTELSDKGSRAVFLKGKTVTDGPGLIALIEDLTGALNEASAEQKSKGCGYDLYKVTGAQIMADGLVVFVDQTFVRGNGYSLSCF